MICEPFECKRYEQFFLDFWYGKNKLLNANHSIVWEYSNRGGRGYLPPLIARERRTRIKEFNNLFQALRVEGISDKEALSIAHKLIPISPSLEDE